MVGILSIIAQTVLLTLLMRTVGNKNTVLLGLSFQTLQLACYGLGSQPWMMWAAGAVAAMSSITFPAVSALVSRSADPDKQGVVQGMVTGIRGLCNGLGPALYGFIFFLFNVELSTLDPMEGDFTLDPVPGDPVPLDPVPLDPVPVAGPAERLTDQISVMEFLEALYRRRLGKKKSRTAPSRSDGALCRSPSESSVNRLATGLLTKVLRFTSRRSEPGARPHSWHTTKLGAGGLESTQLEELCPGGPDAQHTPWHHGYPHPHPHPHHHHHHHQHTSVSTTDLCVGWDSGFSYLRRSPDQFSSRDSLDSLDPPPRSQSQAEPLDHRDHRPPPTRSSASMDLLHNKRDSAYSSFSTSSSIPECLASAPSLRSSSLESVSQRGREREGRSKLPSTASLGNSLSQERDVSEQVLPVVVAGSGSGVCYRGNSSGGTSGAVQGSERHSAGPTWGRSSPGGLQEAPAPPLRSDSYAAARTHQRPNSWSSLDHARSLRSLHKGSWHHSSGSVASGSYTADVQLHTVVEKSPESSPTTRPRQGGAGPQPGPQPGPPGGPPHTGPVLQGSYPLPYSQGPSQGSSQGPSQGSSQGSSQGPSQGPSLGPSQGSSQGPSQGSSQGPSQGPSLGSSQGPSQGPSQGSSQGPSQGPSQGSSQGPSQGPSQGSSQGPSQGSSQGHPALGALGAREALHQLQQGLGPWDQAQQDHPLTRLEMALAEVQRCAGPDGPVLPHGVLPHGVPPHGVLPHGVLPHGVLPHGVLPHGVPPHGGRSLSVLEKVSRFERRDRGVKQRGLSNHSLSNHSYGLQHKEEQSGRSSPCGAEDLRNMLERSGAKAHRTMSYRGRSSDYTQHRNPADPSSVLLRSRSSFHLQDPKPEELHQHLLAPPGGPPHLLLLPDHSSSRPPAPGRVCGRRRLSVLQKKRWFSEPDSLHQAGEAEPETSAPCRRGGGEGSVADRRRMFEGTADSGILAGGGPRPQSPGPRPQSPGPRPPALRQAQQDALPSTIHGHHPVTMETTASVGPSPHPVPGGSVSPGAQDSLVLRYERLPRREASAPERRVQVLLGQLVLRDRSLAPLLDTLASHRTVELMEDVFHGSGLAGKSPWQPRDSSRWDKPRVQDAAGGLETNLDDEDKDLHGTKEELCGALRRSVEVLQEEKEVLQEELCGALRRSVEVLQEEKEVLQEELCGALRRSVEVLQEEKEVLQEELRQHRALGAGLEAVVHDRCWPNEREKYRVFIGDLEKVVNLLLSLSGRLARTESALHHLEDRQEDCTEERTPLLLKRSQLLSQTDDARELKENLDRRRRAVQLLLAGHMTSAQLLLHRRLVAATPSLLIRQRHLDDLIRQGEEHLAVLRETLGPRPAEEEPDWTRGFQLSAGPAPCPLGHAHPARCTAVTSL
ncbi:unnamed protein product [Merluccius merluccius]